MKKETRHIVCDLCDRKTLWPPDATLRNIGIVELVLNHPIEDRAWIHKHVCHTCIGAMNDILAKEKKG